MSESCRDRELLVRWRAGDNSAGSALIKRHSSMLYRFFSTKARGHEEDLIQTTFVACVEARDAFRGESSFGTYLYKLAYFQLLTHYRKLYRTQHIDFTTTSVCDLATSPSGSLLRREENELLARALSRLPIDQQVALELTYWEGLAAPEVADVLGIAENTVYSRLHRAKEHLRTALVRMSDAADERNRALSMFIGSDDD
jgi:RNA polymerase sigma factor (sigma-70 family)